MKQLPNEAFFEWVEEELSQDRPVTFRVRGSSMFPLLKDGKDSVMLYPCVGEELRVMDVAECSMVQNGSDKTLFFKDMEIHR